MPFGRTVLAAALPHAAIQLCCSRVIYELAHTLELSVAVQNGKSPEPIDRVTWPSRRCEQVRTPALPAAFGAHPAFNGRCSQGELSLIFPQPEASPIRRLAGELLRTQAEPSPVQGNVLPLWERLCES
jgi:hypothetical protein